MHSINPIGWLLFVKSGNWTVKSVWDWASLNMEMMHIFPSPVRVKTLLSPVRSLLSFRFCNFFCFHSVLEFNFWHIFVIYFVLYIIVFIFIYFLCACACSFSICLGDLHLKKNLNLNIVTRLSINHIVFLTS